MTGMNPKEFAGTALTIVQEDMKDLDEVVRLCFVALYTNGHVLLEGNPGLGKTALVRALGDTLGFAKGRIQFTPDLMPADITGTYIPIPRDGLMTLEFRPGPINTSLLLADEINRATPKTQSAMLEAMAEKQVTVLGESRKLPVPFMVLATQNPIDHEGTYTLPEAQSDRFMFKLLMPTPLGKTLRKIMAKTTGLLATEHGQSPAGTGISDQTRLAIRDNAPERYQEYCMAIQQRRPLPAVEAHILNILLASNQQFAELDSLSTLDRDQQRKLTQLVEPLFVYGLGPRAATALMLGAKAWSFFFSDAVHETADGSDLARVVLPALRHRLKLHFHWVETYGRKQNTNNTTDIHETALLDQLIADFCILAAPKAAGYQDAFAKTLQAVITQKYGGA